MLNLPFPQNTSPRCSLPSFSCWVNIWIHLTFPLEVVFLVLYRCLRLHSLSLHFNDIAYGPNLSLSVNISNASQPRNEVLSSVAKATQEEKWMGNEASVPQNTTTKSLTQRNRYGVTKGYYSYNRTNSFGSGRAVCYHQKSTGLWSLRTEWKAASTTRWQAWRFTAFISVKCKQYFPYEAFMPVQQDNVCTLPGTWLVLTKCQLTCLSLSSTRLNKDLV